MKEDLVQALAKEHTRTMDMEHLLTRAIYRVLNQTNEVPSQLNNVEKQGRVTFSNDVQSQMRLVAEQLCKRVERRYERRLSEQRQQDQQQTERRLEQVRREYREHVEQMRRQFDREKSSLEESLKEKERSLLQKFELQSLDRENNLEVQRKLLENRFTELKMAKETLEKTSEDFKKKMRADLETVRLEWERLSIKENDYRKVHSFESVDAQNEQLRARMNELEKQNSQLVAKTTKDEMEMNSMRDRIRRMEAELSVRISRDRDWESQSATRQESILAEYSEMRRENQQLRGELAQIKSQSSSVVSSEGEWQRRALAWKAEKESLEYKIKELKLVANLMNEKLRSLTSERGYLRDELRNAKRELYREPRNVRNKRSEHRDQSTKTVSWKERRRSNLLDVSSDDSNESTSTADSLLLGNEGRSEIEKIKKRIRNLDDIARELDVSVEQFTSIRSCHDTERRDRERRDQTWNDEDHHGGYDDFCRSLLREQATSKQSSPQKARTVETEGQQRESAKNRTADRSETQATSRRNLFDELEREPSRPASRAPAPVAHISASPSRDLTAPSSSATTEGNSLADRLRQRNIQRGRGNLVEQSVPLTVPETAAPLPPPVSQPPMTSSTQPTMTSSEENPLFEGVDPVMAHYMKMVMQKKKQEKDETHASPALAPASSPPPSTSNIFEVTASEEIRLDSNPPLSDGEIDW